MNSYLKTISRVFPMAVAAVALTLTSCSDISESERYEYIKPADVGRKVLIEDFTGQRCINCPNATDEIEHLQETYGKDNLIAVGIHSGPLGFKGTAKAVGLATDLGDTYYYHWNIDAQPKGKINRGANSDYATWQGQVNTLIQTQAPLILYVYNQYDEASRQVNIHVQTQGTTGTTTGKLQLWVVEDSIVAMQMMPDGSTSKDYVHNHVLRAAVNGDWGTDVTVNEAEVKSQDFTYTLDEKWVPKHTSIVAFIYNDNGVVQVEKAAVIPVQDTEE